MNLPWLSLTVVFAPCEPVAVTMAPGMVRPYASMIRPEIVPVVSCAAARIATEQVMNAMTATTHNFFTQNPPLNSGTAGKPPLS